MHEVFGEISFYDDIIDNPAGKERSITMHILSVNYRLKAFSNNTDTTSLQYFTEYRIHFFQINNYFSVME